MLMVNLACGRRHHPAWTNLDFHGDGSAVREANLLGRLPFDDGTADAVYSSHFVEHLDVPQATSFLAEIHRILKPGGIVRIVVPDLENLAREYLARLDAARREPSPLNDRLLEFSVMQMIDQMARNEAGGRLGQEYDRILAARDEPLADYSRQRTGVDLLPRPGTASAPAHVPGRASLSTRLTYKWLGLVTQLVPASIRSSVINRTTVGERHLWMWDDLRLRRQMQACGFDDVRTERHDQSRIPEFAKYLLDTNSDGSPYKGEESLYLEAVRPAAR